MERYFLQPPLLKHHLVLFYKKCQRLNSQRFLTSGEFTLSLVSFVAAQQSHNLTQVISKSLDLINYRFPKDIRNVVVKPNMCYYWDYSTGQTTDPSFVGALIEVIRSRISPDVHISIVESDASAMKCKHAFKMLGYEKLAHHYGVDLVNLSQDKGDTLETNAGDQYFKIIVPQTIQKADLRINVPKIKYLTQTGISCALKNIFGCNPYPRKFEYHRRLNEAIVAINKLMRFDLCIVDGIIVSGIHPRRLGLVMASRDPVALDVAAAEIVGVNPKMVKHIMLANKEGIGTPYFSPVGIDPRSFSGLYPRKGPLYTLLSFGYKFLVDSGLDKLLGLSE